ncbi:hypothetical protein MHB40_14870 [Lysinibacillus sp. FSL K6-0057]
MFYSDYIEELECYGVFHTEYDKCYATFSSEQQAENYISDIK